MSKRPIALILGALAAGLIAGCGSGGDNSLTKAEFIKQGDAICLKNGKQIGKEFTHFLKPGATPKTTGSGNLLADFAKAKAVPILQSEAEELNALSAPSGNENEINAIIEALDKGIEGLESGSDDLATNTPPELEKANKLAGEFGFKVCVTS